MTTLLLLAALITITSLAMLWAQIVERRYHEGQAKHWREQHDAEVLRRRRERDASDWWKGDDYENDQSSTQEF